MYKLFFIAQPNVAYTMQTHNYDGEKNKITN
jgi:hypothetical protein